MAEATNYYNSTVILLGVLSAATAATIGWEVYHRLQTSVSSWLLGLSWMSAVGMCSYLDMTRPVTFAVVGVGISAALATVIKKGKV